MEGNCFENCRRSMKRRNQRKGLDLYYGREKGGLGGIGERERAMGWGGRTLSKMKMMVLVGDDW